MSVIITTLTTSLFCIIFFASCKQKISSDVKPPFYIEYEEQVKQDKLNKKNKSKGQ